MVVPTALGDEEGGVIDVRIEDVVADENGTGAGGHDVREVEGAGVLDGGDKGAVVAQRHLSRALS